MPAKHFLIGLAEFLRRDLGYRGVAFCILAVNLVSADHATAQAFSTVHGFAPLTIIDNGNFTFSFSNLDGATPNGGLVTNSSGTILYGVARLGGSKDRGTVFAVNLDGTGGYALHHFTTISNSYPYGNSDGVNPNGDLVRAGDTLYGTANQGGSGGNGTVFAVKADATDFTNLHSFTILSDPTNPGGTNEDGAGPAAGLILSGNRLYGTVAGGGRGGAGGVFAVNLDGTGFTNLYSFTALNNSTNSDGANPRAALLLSGRTLYGTAMSGGDSGNGTVFALNTDGTGFTNLHSFTALSAAVYPGGTNGDGASPQAGLILSGNTLYGTASRGGVWGNGTVFAVNTDGSGFTAVHSFTGGVYIDFGNTFTNSEGAHPQAGAILSGDTIYGTTSVGGSSGLGTVFAVQTNGAQFVNLHTFTPLQTDPTSPVGAGTNTDGAQPAAGLMLSGDTLYGTAANGGIGGNGTVFSLSFRPQLSIAPAGTNVVLSWPVGSAGFSYAGYILEETADLGSVNGWATVVDTNLPVIVNGQRIITRPMLGPQWSYRLKQY